MKRSWTLSALILIGLLSAVPVKAREQATVPANPRVLFIGNSYTYVNNLPDMLADLANSGSATHSIQVEMIATGGATLEEHWREGRALAAIHQGGWDYVVLQEQSLLGGDLSNGMPAISDPHPFYMYARLFDKEIRAAGARTVFMNTWARRDFESQQTALDDAYQHIAKELHAMLVPVGSAWQALRRERPELNLYQDDGSHPVALGTYLTSCMFYAAFFDESPEGLANQITGRAIRAEDRTPAIFAESSELLADIPVSDANWIQNLSWRVYKDQK